MARTSKHDLRAQAETSFGRALRMLGHQVESPPADSGADLVAVIDTVRVPVQIKAATVVNPDVVRRILRSSGCPNPGVVPVIVGDLVTVAAREALRDAGWGWLDRRGHLRFRADGLHLDVDVPADDRGAVGPPPGAISGVAGLSWTSALLMSPDDPPSIRAVARRVELSHSALVTAAKRLREASLVRGDGRPLVPELFWAMADAWQPQPVALASLPEPGAGGSTAALGVNLDGPGSGWAVAGTVGAAAWGAPVAVGAGYPPDFLVPNQHALRQATLRLGQAARFEERACTVAVAPTPLVCVERFDRLSGEWGHWRFAHGVFAALDLAQDHARGAEILADWMPTDFARVW